MALISMSVGSNRLETATQYNDEHNLTFNYVWSNQAEEVERPKFSSSLS